MTGRLPWVAATIVIVIAAGLGAWALTQPAPAPATFSTTGPWTVYLNGIPVASGWQQGQSGWQGIENIFLITWNLGDNTRDFSGQQENWLTQDENSVFSATGQTKNVPYEQKFDIVVDVKLYAPDNMAYATEENLYVYMSWSGYTSNSDNSLSPYSPTSAIEFVYENSGYGTTSGYVRVNVRFNNRDNVDHFKIPAAASLSLDTVSLYGWK